RNGRRRNDLAGGNVEIVASAIVQRNHLVGVHHWRRRGRNRRRGVNRNGRRWRRGSQRAGGLIHHARGARRRRRLRCGGYAGRRRGNGIRRIPERRRHRPAAPGRAAYARLAERQVAAVIDEPAAEQAANDIARLEIVRRVFSQRKKIVFAG